MKLFKRSFFKKKEEKKEIKKSPLLFEESQEIIRNLKKFYGGGVLTYWIPKWIAMDQNQVYAVNKILQDQVASDKLFVFLKSYGGSGEAALRAVHLFRHYYKEITILVPLECASAATILALGADKIKMGPIAHLSPVDISTVHELGPYVRNAYPARVNHVELDRALQLWKDHSKEKDPNIYSKMFKYIHPLVFGAVDRANAFSFKLTEEVQAYYEKDGHKTQKISDDLNFGYPDHSYPITLKEAIKIGLNVERLEREPNQWLLQLNDLYSKSANEVLTEYNALKHHSRQIQEIFEMDGEKIYFQSDFESHYNKELQYWVDMKDQSGWKSLTLDDEGEEKITPFYIK